MDNNGDGSKNRKTMKNNGTFCHQEPAMKSGIKVPDFKLQNRPFAVGIEFGVSVGLKKDAAEPCSSLVDFHDYANHLI